MKDNMKKLLCFVLLFCGLTACGGLYVDGPVEDDDDDREGEISLPEELNENLSWFELLKNCKPEVNVPGSVIDIGLEAINLRQYYPPSLMRDCLQAKLEDAHDRICTAREGLERKREEVNGSNNRARVDNAILRLDEIQFKFNQRMYELASDIEDQIEDEKEGRYKTKWGRFMEWVRRDEYEAVRDTLDIASYSECNSYTDDDI